MNVCGMKGSVYIDHEWNKGGYEGRKKGAAGGDVGLRHEFECTDGQREVEMKTHFGGSRFYCTTMMGSERCMHGCGYVHDARCLRIINGFWPCLRAHIQDPSSPSMQSSNLTFNHSDQFDRRMD